MRAAIKAIPLSQPAVFFVRKAYVTMISITQDMWHSIEGACEDRE